MPRGAARTALLLGLCALHAAPAIARAKVEKPPPSTRLLLDNGFEAVLIPNRATPLVTSVVIVRAGSSRETPALNGISHLLEHLLFNGTARRTQEQISEEQDRHGIISNAHTAADHTAYFVMAAREHCGRALDMQADMLFGSIFPEEKLAKEREIVVNEIARDRVRDETIMEELYASRLYHPGGHELPVAGTEESVRALPRDAILAHYRAWYVPNNMTAVIMGDFEVDEMASLVRRHFGAAAPGLLEPPPAGAVNATALGLAHARSAPGGARLLWLGAPAPGMGGGAFDAAGALAALLGRDLARAVDARLRASGARGSLVEAVARLDAHAGASTIQVRASLDPALGWEEAARALLDEVAGRLAASEWKSEDLDALRLEEKASLMRLWEKPHYFGLDRAPLIATGGWELARDQAGRLGWVEPADIKDVARPLAAPGRWAVFMVGPGAPLDGGSVSVAGETGGARPGAPKTRHTAASRALTAAWKGPQPAGSRASESLPAAAAAGKGPINVRAVLPNGLLVSLDLSDDSRIFAAHVLVKGRSASEPAGKSGIADLLHRLAGSGTRGHPGPALSAALRAIGGTLKVTDDPEIPYDDIYLSPEFSFIRLEALDQFAGQALDLLREILSAPLLADEAALAAARGQLLDRARQARSSPRERCRLLLARGLWGADHPFASPLFGTEETIASISAADLESFHRSYFSPRNMILGVGSSVRADKLLPMLEAKLGRWSWPEARASRAPALPAAPGDVEGAPRLLGESLEAPQAYLMQGRLAPAGPVTQSTWDALAATLTRRMSERLREQRGLAYALGAEASPLAGQVQIIASMGVLPERVEEARAGLREVIGSLAATPPSSRELESAVRSAEIRMLARGLSRINRAYGRCLEEMRRRRPDASAAKDEAPASVSAEQVAAAARWLMQDGSLDRWVEAVVGRAAPEAAR